MLAIKFIVSVLNIIIMLILIKFINERNIKAEDKKMGKMVFVYLAVMTALMYC